MHLAAAWPWWDQAEPRTSQPSPTELQELAGLDRRVDEADGLRVWAQQKARPDMRQEGAPITRLSLCRRDAVLLDATNR